MGEFEKDKGLRFLFHLTYTRVCKTFNRKTCSFSLLQNVVFFNNVLVQ